MAGAFVWLASGWLGNDPPPPQQVAQAPAQPDANAAKGEQPKSGRRRRAASITGPGGSSGAEPAAPSGASPVAVDSGFRRGQNTEPTAQGEKAGLRTMYLSKILLATSENVKGGILFNQAAFAPVLRAGNTVFDQGVAMHAPEKGEGIASFKVPEGTKQFHANVGFANLGSPDVKRCDTQGGSATFTVFTNGLQKFHKIVVGTDGVHDVVRLDLGPEVTTVTLVVDNADGDSTCDAAIWGDARFMVEPPAAATAKATP